MITETPIPRFRWNYRKNARLINRYIDTICRDFPAIAKGVVKKGIGPLDIWFSQENDSSYGPTTPKNATCGCLVGTTCLVAMKKNPTALRKTGIDLEETGHDAAMILYQLIVQKTKRDVSRYSNPIYAMDARVSEGADPLLVLIHDAGIAASDEAVPSYRVSDAEAIVKAGLDLNDVRSKQVIDHMENRIRKNLNIPYPNRGQLHG